MRKGLKKRILKWVMIVMVLAVGGTGAYVAWAPKFGKIPDGERLKRIELSPNYIDGEFRNLESTEVLTGNKNHLSMMFEFLFAKRERLRPSAKLPTVKTDLKALDANTDLVVWFGHSSIFLQINGHRILIDPVFGDNAAPFFFLNKAFEGEYSFTIQDLPEIDYLIISHDHWDHLEYRTMAALQAKVKSVVCPLGVGSHLEYWGFDPKRIHEGDWNDSVKLASSLTVHILPARHFSGRFLKRNKTLWAAYMLETPDRRIFFSGDTGYGRHFSEIGRKFGEVDLAILENGQYDPNWANIHMFPEDTARAAEDLKAKAVLPIHLGRFSISNHTWDDPFRRIYSASLDKNFRLLTPLTGEVVYLDDADRKYERWWERIK
jgi:L-ascorbate metabolism protein UlaG (beta-lactamase superfamily)